MLLDGGSAVALLRDLLEPGAGGAGADPTRPALTGSPAPARPSPPGQPGPASRLPWNRPVDADRCVTWAEVDRGLVEAARGRPLTSRSPTTTAVHLAAVRVALARAGSGAPSGAAGAFKAVDWLGTPLIVAAARIAAHHRWANITCIHVPNPACCWVLAGRPAVSVAGLASLPPRHGLSLVMTGYRDRFTVTVLSDGTHRDLAGRFAAALGEEFALLAGPVADQPTSRRA